MLINKTICALVLLGFCQLAGAGVYEDMVAAVNEDKAPTINALLNRGVDPDTTDQEGNTLLMLAAAAGSGHAIVELLAARAKVNAKNQLGETALMLASINGHLEIVRSLVLRGANVNQSGWTPLMYAATRDHVNIARLLISYGAKVDAAADNGYTALMMATRENKAGVVALLLANGADPNLTAQSGASAKSIAQEKKNPEITKLLANDSH